jgi:hypothetical protein
VGLDGGSRAMLSAGESMAVRSVADFFLGCLSGGMSSRPRRNFPVGRRAAGRGRPSEDSIHPSQARAPTKSARPWHAEVLEACATGELSGNGPAGGVQAARLRVVLAATAIRALLKSP